MRMKLNLKPIFLVAFGALVLVLSARIDFSIPGIPVPQTAQTLAILLVVALFPDRAGVYSVLVYLILGAVGLPVFSDGGSGFKHLLGNTGGYLLGFLLAAVFLDQLIKRINLKRIVYAFGAAVKAHFVILLTGWFWLGTKIGYAEAYYAGVEPFLLGAVVKSIPAAICLSFTSRIRSRLKRWGF